MSHQTDIVLFEDGDGILVFGGEQSLSMFDSEPGVIARSLSPQALSKVGHALTTAGEAQAQSGRWLKLTSESKALVDRLGPSLAKSDGLMTGCSSR